MLKGAADLLKIAGGISTMWSLAAFACVLLFLIAARTGKAKPSRFSWGLLIGILLLGLTPIMGSIYLQVEAHANAQRMESDKNRGAYDLRIVVKRKEGGAIITDANVRSSVGIAPGRQEGVYEFTIPYILKPADGNVEITADVASESLSGRATVNLRDDFHPTLTVWVEHPGAVHVSGNAITEDGTGIRGARVSVAGYGEQVFTANNGWFDLPAHAGKGQQITLHVEKSGFSTLNQAHTLGDLPATLVLYPSATAVQKRHPVDQGTKVP